MKNGLKRIGAAFTVVMTVVNLSGCGELAAKEIKVFEEIRVEQEKRPPMAPPPMIEGDRPMPPEGEMSDMGMKPEASDSMGTTMMSTLTVEEANAIEAELVAEVDTASLIGTYPINDTGTVTFYSGRASIKEPSEGDDFYGQDASYTTNSMSFTNNSDGSVTDNVTGLIWLQPAEDKMTWEEAVDYAGECDKAGCDDWRLPTIKELYSLIDFTGDSEDLPYINRDYFDFQWGDAYGGRQIDAQYATTTIYDSTTMGGNTTMFGVNFADGRIKGYPVTNEFFVMLVRGEATYGLNNYVDNGDGTVTDLATGLMWMTLDSGHILGDNGFMNWEEALAWAEDMDYAGYDDWKLPDTKELHSIVDYERSPDTTDSAAIDPLFETTGITNLEGAVDYGFYWTSTTHAEMNPGAKAVYIAFGRCTGEMEGEYMDVHGAGAQRSDPKSGDYDSYPSMGNGPQGDEQRVYNLVRLVRIAD